MLKYGLFGNETGFTVYLVLFGILAAAYLLGGINTAIFVSRIGYHDDVRKYGSKNAGLTNVLRVYGKKAAAFTLLGDIAKTILACFIGSLFLGQTGAYIAGCGAVIGHVWPVYFGFKGGKGVLAFFAAAIYCNPTVFLIVFTIFVIIVSFSKYISLGSVMCAAIYPLILSRFIGSRNLIILPVLFISVLIIVKHWGNIKRLRDGNENKVHLGKNGEFLPKWLLIIVCLVLAGASVGTVVFQMFVKSGSIERGKPAVYSGDTKITQIGLRILFIDGKNEYFDKNAQNDESDEIIMTSAVSKAYRYTLLNRAAVESGFAIPQSTEEYLNNYISAVLPTLDGWNETDSAESYIIRTYGTGVKPNDLLGIIRARLYAEDFEKSIGTEAAEKLLNDTTDGYEVSVNEKIKEEIIKKY